MFCLAFVVPEHILLFFQSLLVHYFASIFWIKVGDKKWKLRGQRTCSSVVEHLHKILGPVPSTTLNELINQLIIITIALLSYL